MSDSLARDDVQPLLQGRFGGEYVYVERCPSTQRLLTADAPEGTVAVANEQTEGRGRLGRQWLAPAGTGLLCSIALVPPVPTEQLPQLSLVAGEAVATAIAEVTGLEPVLKPPNDVLLDGRKVAGILAEAREGRVVLGIGVNVKQRADQLPAGLETAATSLELESGGTVDRGALLVAILAHLERGYDQWVATASG